MNKRRSLVIKEEQPEDAATIRHLVTTAFDQSAEADLVDALRLSGDTALSLVAEQDGAIVGHILFSMLKAPVGCLALAPVAVEPNERRMGIGSKLIKAGLARVAGKGYIGVFVLGDPAYYRRFGFDLATAAPFATDYPRDYFMALALQPGALTGLRGAVEYGQAFRELG